MWVMCREHTVRMQRQSWEGHSGAEQGKYGGQGAGEIQCRAVWAVVPSGSWGLCCEWVGDGDRGRGKMGHGTGAQLDLSIRRGMGEAGEEQEEGGRRRQRGREGERGRERDRGREGERERNRGRGKEGGREREGERERNRGRETEREGEEGTA